ncbi:MULTISPECIES: hypothetical protein [Brachybacterium]|nr:MULTISPECIES: hypothetical protein [Brachybacterium]MCZ4328092.1 hypothetical protein [Brachybacterium paraconglomeratum]
MTPGLVTVAVGSQANSVRTLDRTDPSLLAPLDADCACWRLAVRA